MRKFLCILLLAISVITCQDGKKSSSEKFNKVEVAKEDASVSLQDKKLVTDGEDVVKEESSPLKLDNSRPEPSTLWSGEFIKTNALNTSGTCSCNCLSIDFNATRTLCIDEKLGIDIQVNYVLKENSVQIIYLNGKGNLDDKNPIPWSDFDKNVVAEISTINNQMHLDWKGFTINNELATDYAILGKKNLEGNYKRK